MKNRSYVTLFCLVIIGLATAPTATVAVEKSKAVEEMKKTEAVLKGGEIATSVGGFSMKAKLNGQDWVAKTMMRPQDTGRILGLKGEESISLPFSRSRMVVGRTIKFGANMAVDLFLDDGVGLYGATSGEMTFTKVDEASAEGTFFFTATSSDDAKKIEATNGTFRILLSKR